MKKIILIILISLITFTACNLNTEDTNTSNDQINIKTPKIIHSSNIKPFYYYKDFTEDKNKYELYIADNENIYKFDETIFKPVGFTTFMLPYMMGSDQKHIVINKVIDTNIVFPIKNLENDYDDITTNFKRVPNSNKLVFTTKDSIFFIDAKDETIISKVSIKSKSESRLIEFSPNGKYAAYRLFDTETDLPKLLIINIEDYTYKEIYKLNDNQCFTNLKWLNNEIVFSEIYTKTSDQFGDKDFYIFDIGGNINLTGRLSGDDPRYAKAEIGNNYIIYTENPNDYSETPYVVKKYINNELITIYDDIMFEGNRYKIKYDERLNKLLQVKTTNPENSYDYFNYTVYVLDIETRETQEINLSNLLDKDKKITQIDNIELLSNNIIFLELHILNPNKSNIKMLWIIEF